MTKNPLEKFISGDNSAENYEKFDLHRPFVDEIILVSPSGKKMFREEDLIDVWFDSGSMPYAQAHYPFENKDNFCDMFPADFIAEGVDQTQGLVFYASCNSHNDIRFCCIQKHHFKRTGSRQEREQDVEASWQCC